MKVILTRENNAPLAKKLESRGIAAISFPCIKTIAIAPDKSGMKKILKKFDWIVFTSRNGVKYFFECLQKNHYNKCIPNTGFAAIGPGTASALAALGLKAKKIPQKNSTVCLAEALGNIKGKSVLLPLSKIAGASLETALKKNGAKTTRLDIYDTKPAEKTLSPPADASAIVFTSPSTVRGFKKLAGKSFAKTTAIAIGATTGNAARKAGFKDIIVPARPTEKDLINAILSMRGEA